MARADGGGPPAAAAGGGGLRRQAGGVRAAAGGQVGSAAGLALGAAGARRAGGPPQRRRHRAAPRRCPGLQPIRMSDGSLLLMNMNGDVNHRDVSQGRLSPLRCATPQPSCTASEGSDAGTPSVAWGPGWQLDGAVNNWLPNEFHCGRHSPKLLLSACLNFKSVRAR